MSQVTHETVFFTGHVQGVGFRYTTVQVAKEFEVTGFVRNLADGRVELQAEGEPGELDAFIKAVEDRLHGYVRKTDRVRQKRDAQFAGFTIR